MAEDDPIGVGETWDDDQILLLEEFCELFTVPLQAVEEWRRHHCGPTWYRFNGTGRLYTTGGEVRRYMRGWC